jgi:hypothetical protein
MTTQISRRTLARSVLAGVASVPVATIPAIEVIAGTDPIYAVIEKHRAAFIRQMAACRLQSHTSVNDPDHDEIEPRLRAYLRLSSM